MKMSFGKWLAFYGLISQFIFIDILTDSQFTGKTLRAIECDENINEIWHKTWQDSLFGIIPTPNLKLIVLAWWILTLLQMVLPLLRTLRSSDIRFATTHEVGDSAPDKGFLCSATLLQHDTVFLTLADASGMATVQCMAIPMALDAVQVNPPSSASDAAPGRQFSTL